MQAEPKRDLAIAQAAVLRRYGVRATSTYVYVPALGGRAHALIAGEGPPVLMLNGIGTPAVMWAPLLAHLDGFRLHAVDLPAYGLTDAPAQNPRNLRAHAVAYLEGLLDGLRLDRPAFISNSLGSLWTLWLAIARPSRVGP